MGIFWFAALAFMIAMYVVLDGFDLGAGIIFLKAAKTDEERRMISGPRKKLYKVSGPKGQLFSNKSSLESYASNEQSLEFFTGATGEPLGDRIYLEGIIYYQDEDCALIVHLDQLGQKSNRMLTCIDMKSGKEKWTIQQDDLFKKMKIDENKDSFSSLFFTKDDIKVKRSGGLVTLQFKGEGMMGFDYETGKKLWTLDI